MAGAESSSRPRPGVQELMLRLNNVNRLDMKTSVEIAGIANCITRDENGNLLPIVWTRQSVYNEYENATLLTRDALQKHLQTFIDAGVKDNIEILQKVEDPAVFVDWVVRIAQYWERRYALKRDEKYDISQTVFSAMFELVNANQIWPLLKMKGLARVEKKLQSKIEELREHPESNKFYVQLKAYIADNSPVESELESHFWLHRGTHAIVRFLFRTECVPELRERLCILAGKLLQKKEVCNKAGGYASQRQRADVVQEYCHAVDFFQRWLGGLHKAAFDALEREFENPHWIFLIIDHTALPVTFSHLSIPPVNPDETRRPLCPHCSGAQLDGCPPAKRSRGGAQADEAWMASSRPPDERVHGGENAGGW
jgi:hypothetical protein